MCGIVGYVGDDNATPILLHGLQKLEYRGYDSAGIAVRLHDDGINVVKAIGKSDLLAHNTVRVSFSKDNTIEDVDIFLSELNNTLRSIR